MIQRLRIRNWRAYRDATVELGYPMVFFVAPNGVGKSSFYEAIRGCLLGFPKGRSAGKAVRADADKAELSMDLMVGDSVVRVVRTLTRTGRSTFDASLNDEPLDEDGLLSLLQTSWAAPPALLDRLMFGDLDALGRSKMSLPIRDHLADLLGVTPMLEAATVLRAAQSTAKSAVEGLRGEVGAFDEAIREAKRSVAEAEQAFDQVESERLALGPRVTAAEAAANAAAAWAAYRAEVAAYNRQVSELMHEIGELIAVDPAAPSSSLDAARLAAEEDIEAVRTAIADADRAAITAATASDLLSEPVAVCPTCLRPLSNEERLEALHAHGDTATMARSDNERGIADIARAERHLRVIGEFTTRLDRLRPPIAPSDPDPGSEAVAELAELRTVDGDLAERLGEARAMRQTAQVALNRAQAGADTAEALNAAAREELLLDTTAAVFESVANRYLSERIEPLTRDVAQRWKLVFGTEGLVLDPAGEIRLRRGDIDLGLDDMSGGERAVAGIIVRLLVTAAATRIPSIWFDEPLEHLDPRRRAAVAQTLVQAVAADTVNQMVVTTYEEGIARRLARAAPDLVKIIYAEMDGEDVPEDPSH